MTVIELKNAIVESLRNSKHFSGIYTFGSIAKGISDEYSDIDMIASVVDEKINLSDILRPFLTVLYYRSFSSSTYPSGRYWFRNFSPFHRLDISFHSPSETRNIIAYGDLRTFKSPPFKCEWISKSEDLIEGSIGNAEYDGPKVSDVENNIGRHIYKLQCAIKSMLRHQPEEYSLENIITNIIHDWIHHYGQTWNGGDLDELAMRTFAQIPQSGLLSYLKVEESKSSEREEIQRHYKICKYGGNVPEECTTITGKIGKSIVGVFRLSRESNTIVLRAMQVLPIVRGMGIGSRMLHNALPMIKNETVYCLPYAHLVDFYGKVGFKCITETTLSEFLCKRMNGYLDKGLQVCAMQMN